MIKILILLTLILLAGCNSEIIEPDITDEPDNQEDIEPQTFQIRLEKNRVVPYYIIIPKGSTVIWINKEQKIHRIIGDNGEFDSKDLKSNRVFSFTFKETGTYNYHSTHFPDMRGTIIVN